MSVYLANIGLLFIWAFFLLKIKSSEKKRIAFCAIACTQWVLISGLRDLSVGADTVGYRRQYLQIATQSWAECFRMFEKVYVEGDGKDPGYTLLVKIFQIFNLDYRCFLFFVAIIFTGSMAVWIYRNSTMPCMSFLIYSILFYSFYSITGIRQTIATALIVFVGYKFVRERKLLPFLLIAAIAFTIHKSTAVFIPYYFIANFELKPIWIGICSLLGAAFLIFRQRLYVPIMLLLTYDEEQAESVSMPGSTFTFTFLMLGVIVLTFLVYPFVNKRRSDARFLYNALIMAAIFVLMTMQNQGFMRVQQYYSLFVMLAIPEIIQSMDKKYRSLVYFAIAGAMVVMFITTRPSYRFFWQ